MPAMNVNIELHQTIKTRVALCMVIKLSVIIMSKGQWETPTHHVYKTTYAMHSKVYKCIIMIAYFPAFLLLFNAK